MTNYDWLDTAICVLSAGALMIGGGMLIGSCSEHIEPLPQEKTAVAQTAPISTQPPMTQKRLVAASTPDGPYLLRLENETLAIYAKGNAQPFERYALSSAWLPEYDRALLEYGIEVESTLEMRRLVEDYLS